MRRLALILALLLPASAHAGVLADATPAERERGCTWASHFRSASDVESDGGAVTGAPTFSTTGGVTLDGTNDNLVFNLTGSEFNSATISVRAEFTPHFDYDDDADSAILDTTAGSQILIYKRNNAGSNGLRIYLGNTLIAQIAEGTYSSAWLVNQRNVLVVSGTTGDTSAWLNGTEILTADATAWTAARFRLSLYVGSLNDGASYRFDGTIHSVQVYHAQLTAQEAQDFYDQSTYTYWDDATAIWRMCSEDHDPTNTRTLDRTGNGYHLTAVSDPEKLGGCGYRYDGSADYHMRTRDGTFNPTGDMTALALVRTRDLTATRTIVSQWNTTGNQRGWWITHNNGNDWVVGLSKDGEGAGSISWKNSNDVVQYGMLTFAGFTYDYVADGTSILTVYADGNEPQVKTDAIGPIHDSTSDVVVGASGAGGDLWEGDIYSVAVWTTKRLTPLQMHDARLTLKRRYNEP